MKKILLIFLVLSLFSFTALAAEKSKDMSAKPSAKKKLKGIPPGGVKPTASDGELTEEEKKFAKEMAAKIPSKDEGPRQKVGLPENLVVTQPPKLPELRPKAPPTAPKAPGSELIIRIPRAPERIRQSPNNSAPEKPPTAPKKL